MLNSLRTSGKQSHNFVAIALGQSLQQRNLKTNLTPKPVPGQTPAEEHTPKNAPSGQLLIKASNCSKPQDSTIS